MDKELIYAIIKCESGFNKNALSPADAHGLMQITPETFDWLKKHYTHDLSLNCNEIKNPETNINYGVLFLCILKKKYSDEKVVLSAYNAGMSVVQRWLSDKNTSKDGVTLENIPYKETRDYVNRVQAVKKIYKILYFTK